MFSQLRYGIRLTLEGQIATIIVLAVLGWPWGARVIRAQTLAIRNRDFAAASRETGERTWRIIAFEIVPNEVSLIAASFMNTVLYAIGASVALAFIGLADSISWSLGTMLYLAQSCSTPGSTSSATRGCATSTGGAARGKRTRLRHGSRRPGRRVGR